MTPPDAGGEIVVRPPHPHEVDLVIAVDELAFSSRVSPGTRERALADIDAGLGQVAVIDGELAGLLVNYPTELTLPGRIVAPATAVSAVAVLPTHRRRGALRALMTRALEETHEAGIAFSTLFASEATIYGRFGFGVCSFGVACRLERARATLRPAPTEAGRRLRVLSPSEALQAAPAVLELARVERAGEVQRLASWWEALFAEEEPARSPRRVVVCTEVGGMIDGYAIYEVSDPPPSLDERPRQLVVHELVTVSPTARQALWSFLVGVDLVDEIAAYSLPVDEPVRHLLDDSRAFEVRRLADRTWLRLVDVGAALAARRYDAAGALVLAVSDPVCRWNAGSYLLEAGEDGVASVVRSNEPPELELSAATLASAYLGASPMSALVAGGLVAEHRPGAAARADRLLASRPAPYCTVEF